MATEDSQVRDTEYSPPDIFSRGPSPEPDTDSTNRSIRAEFNAIRFGTATPATTSNAALQHPTTTTPFTFPQVSAPRLTIPEEMIAPATLRLLVFPDRQSMN